jgi:hypothetical protein
VQVRQGVGEAGVGELVAGATPFGDGDHKAAAPQAEARWFDIDSRVTPSEAAEVAHRAAPYDEISSFELVAVASAGKLALLTFPWVISGRAELGGGRRG